MVKVIGGIKYECPYCGDTFDEYMEADDCASDCAASERDTPNEVESRKLYVCKYCEKTHGTMFLAEECEQEHIDAEDKYYDEYEHHESMLRLQEAAAHPEQISLQSFGD